MIIHDKTAYHDFIGIIAMFMENKILKNKLTLYGFDMLAIL